MFSSRKPPKETSSKKKEANQKKTEKARKRKRQLKDREEEEERERERKANSSYSREVAEEGGKLNLEERRSRNIRKKWVWGGQADPRKFITATETFRVKQFLPQVISYIKAKQQQNRYFHVQNFLAIPVLVHEWAMENREERSPEEDEVDDQLDFTLTPKETLDLMDGGDGGRPDGQERLRFLMLGGNHWTRAFQLNSEVLTGFAESYPKMYINLYCGLTPDEARALGNEHNEVHYFR